MTRSPAAENKSEKRARIAFIASGLLAVFGYGYCARDQHRFPYQVIEPARETWRTLHKEPDYFSPAVPRPSVAKLDRGKAYDGLNVITSVTAQSELSIRVADLDGKVLKEWKPDWFALWPDAKHVPLDEIPKSRPGAHLHGTLLLENGDVLFNFDRLGLLRLDRCGKVVWRLPYLTHHTVFLAEDGTFWVTADIVHEAPLKILPSYKPPFVEPIVLHVSQEGKVLRQISILDVLLKNDLLSLLLMRGKDPWAPTISGDTVHLNDIDVFPEHLPAGFFKPGDLMISLRNVDTVMVLDPANLAVKFRMTGRTIGQHDPDFVDGNTFSVFDNNNSATDAEGASSRIVRVTAPSGELSVVYTTTPSRHFFTHKMGKHQFLPNGNLLLTETYAGRAFEVATDGSVVWEVANPVDDKRIALIEEVTRVPRSYGAAFAPEAMARCAPAH